MEIRFSGHSSYRTQYHIVWIPKYRRRILKPGLASYLRKLWPKLLRQIPGVELLEQNIQIDHIHSIMIIPPKYSVSEVVGKLKGQSSRACPHKGIGTVVIIGRKGCHPRDGVDRGS